jgi:LytS/YehU family sensor histidine kinase
MVCEHFPKETDAPAKARHMLDCLDGRVEPALLADARLLVSEVVANAVEHVPADGDIGVAVSFEDARLRVEVTDPGDGFEPGPRDASSDRGWGLQFVNKLSSAWGVAASAPGCVWFELEA